MRIKIERVLLILLLLGLFLGCFYVMNLNYDTFARYNYELQEDEKRYLSTHLDSSETEFIITNQINPEVLFRFIYNPGFELNNCLWYQEALDTQPEDINYIIGFVNAYRKSGKLTSFQDVGSYLTNYTYATLEEFFNATSPYLADSTLIRNPKRDTLTLLGNYSVYNYVPENLVEISGVKVNPKYGESILIKKEALPSLQNMCIELTKMFESECGGLEVSIGYLSFDVQKEIFSDYMLEYGKDEFSKHWDYPSQNEYQLGYTIKFDFSDEELSKEKKDELKAWLASHAHEYGYVVRYPANKVSETGKVGQDLTLRYVGKEVANDLHSKGNTLNDYK